MYDLQPAGFLKWCLRLPSEYEQNRRENTLLWHGNPHICPKITTRSSFNANSILFLSLHWIRFPLAIKCLQNRDTIEMATHANRALPPQPLSAFRGAHSTGAAPGRRNRGTAGPLPGVGVASHCRPSAFRGLAAPWGCKQAGEPALRGYCSPSCPSTSAPTRRCGENDWPPWPFPSRLVWGATASPNPPRTPRAGPRAPLARSRSAARAGPAERDGVAGVRRWGRTVQ